MDKLLELINELETKIPFSEKTQLSISSASVGWHIKHALLVLSQITKALEKSDPKEYQWKFNLNRMFVYTLNKIPRGKGKAPKSVIPNDEIINENLVKDFQLIRTEITVLTSLKPDHYFKHPYFGNLNLKATFKMLKMHTKHHLDIINDIVKS